MAKRTANRMHWGVWCMEWGGITATRSNWLWRQGRRVEYATREEAEAEAARIQSRANLAHLVRAQFRYTARPLYAGGSYVAARAL